MATNEQLQAQINSQATRIERIERRVGDVEDATDRLARTTRPVVERIRRAFRNGERHARAIGALAAKRAGGGDPVSEAAEHERAEERAELRRQLVKAQRERDEARADATAANRLLSGAGIRNAEAEANALRAAVRRFFEAQDLPAGEHAEAREALMRLI